MKHMKMKHVKKTKTLHVFILLIIISLLIMVLFLSSAFAINFDIEDKDEDGVKDIQQTGWFIYPLLPGFYEVEDWEVAVCLWEAGGESMSPQELGSVLDTAMLREYPGQIDTVRAYVEKDVPDPEDPYKTTNLYTVCWSVLPMGDKSMKYSVYLKGAGSTKLEIESNDDAQPYVGAGDCKTVYSDLKLTKAHIVVSAGQLPGENIIDWDTKDEVVWD